jgi:hypothetical protein
MRAYKIWEIRNRNSILRGYGVDFPKLIRASWPDFLWHSHLSILAYLTQIHNDALMDLLPQVSSEYLDERDLQRGDLAMHEDTCQVQLHLKAYIHLPWKRECDVRDQGTWVLRT